MTISHTATQLVNNPPPMLAQVFADHRAQFGVRDLEQEVTEFLAPMDEAYRNLERAYDALGETVHGIAELVDSVGLGV